MQHLDDCKTFLDDQYSEAATTAQSNESSSISIFHSIITVRVHGYIDFIVNFVPQFSACMDSKIGSQVIQGSIIRNMLVESIRGCFNRLLFVSRLTNWSYENVNFTGRI